MFPAEICTAKLPDTVVGSPWLELGIDPGGILVDWPIPPLKAYHEHRVRCRLIIKCQALMSSKG
jgi:hypothetical protein